MERISESELLKRIDAFGEDISPQAYDELSSVRMHPAEADQLPSMDPFSSTYRQMAFDLYTRLSQRASYVPEVNEQSGMGEVADIWRGSSPFSFGTSKFVSEFLVAWAAIFHALDVSKGQRVLEYGSGSGQALLMLARTGVKAFGVDIDAASASLVRRQSDLMNLDVEVECAEFGEGFEGQTFDRILFFEAFHHAFDFCNLLVRLHQRLAAGGHLVFCGEPVVSQNDDAVPYPWGPRMDALSVLCIRRFGWMELGFQTEFFISALMSCGWSVTQVPNPVYRAVAYVARPWGAGELMLGDTLLLPAGWSAPEGTHRWTVSERVGIPLPWQHKRYSRLSLKVANYLPEPKVVSVEAGGKRVSLTVKSGHTEVLTLTGISDAREVTLTAPLTSPPADIRRLGIAAISLSLGD